MVINEPLREAVNAALKRGWSIRRIATETGITQPSLSRWIRKERGISTEAAEALCEFFGMKLTKGKIPKPN